MTHTKKAKPGREVAGLALAGGRSRRFGREKAVAMLHGRPLLAWSVASLSFVSTTVIVSAPEDSGAAELTARMGRPRVGDRPDHAAGPLAGLAAGLAWASAHGFDLVVSTPCDCPWVGPDALSSLLAASERTGAAHAATADGVQGLCAVWPVSVAEALGERLAQGDHPSVRAFLDEIASRSVRFAEAWRFANLNTPGDLAASEAREPPPWLQAPGAAPPI